MPAPGATAWATLREAGIVVGEPPTTEHGASPWYVRAMVGIAGWIAAGFLLFFFALAFGSALDEPSARIEVGLVLILAAGFTLGLLPHNDFTTQLGLAGSFCGQALVFVGLLESFDWTGSAVWLTIAALAAALTVAVPHGLHRTWCAFAATGALWAALRAGDAPTLGAGLVAAVAGGLWLAEFARPREHGLVAATAYGATLALFAVEGFTIMQRWFLGLLGEAYRPEWHYLWLGEAITGAVLIVVVGRLAAQAGLSATTRQGAAALLAAAVVTLASCRAPGIAAAVMIVVLGFAHGNRVLLGLGIVALLGAVSAYYYGYEATLLAKAQVLATIGAALLAARIVVRRWLWPGGEAAGA